MDNLKQDAELMKQNAEEMSDEELADVTGGAFLAMFSKKTRVRNYVGEAQKGKGKKSKVRNKLMPFEKDQDETLNSTTTINDGTYLC